MKNPSLRSFSVAVIIAIATLIVAYTVSINQYFAVNTAEAQSLPVSLEGYAWSSYINPISGAVEGVGWISFSCENTDTCVGGSAPGPKIDYGVEVDAVGTMTGNAWNSNIGWIRFGGLSGFPTAVGNPGGNAQFVPAGSDFEMQGWARACAVFVSGCSGALLPSNQRGGWDGWISLTGDLYDTTFTAGTANTDAFAWGGDLVVGWISFNAGFDPVTMIEAPAINSFSAIPDEVLIGSNVTLAWNVQGMTSCSASNSRGQTDWDASTAVSVAAGTNNAIVTPPEGVTNYGLTCTGTDGLTYALDASVVAKQDIQINALSCTNCAASSLPAPQSDGTYDGIQFIANVTGLAGANTAPFELEFAGETVTGNVGTGNNTITINNITFGYHNAELEVDLPAPGTIDEDVPSTVIDEDIDGNTRNLNNILIVPPPPTMIMTPVQDLVRVDETADIDVEISSTYDATCILVGSGMPGTSAPISILANVPFIQTYTTDPLQSTTIFQLTCTEPITSTSFSEEIRIEVVPNLEEI